MCSIYWVQNFHIFLIKNIFKTVRISKKRHVYNFFCINGAQKKKLFILLCFSSKISFTIHAIDLILSYNSKNTIIEY